METKTINHNNGNSTKYKILENGTAYHIETPAEVCEILEANRKSRERIKIYYGDTKTGRDWMEEHDKIGTIGRSTGNIKIPLLIKTNRSLGGGAILDNCIVKITKNGYTLYQHPQYNRPKIEIQPADMPEYSHMVLIDGQIYSRHKTERAAKILVKKLS